MKNPLLIFRAAARLSRFSSLTLALGLVLVLSAAPARATLVTYELTFSSSFSLLGSGNVTFDDTAMGAGTIVTGSKKYLFPNVSGAGTAAFGTWTSSFFEYNPLDGLAIWDLQGSKPSSFSFDGPAGPGLSPAAALEGLFQSMETDKLLAWSRQVPPSSTGVPDGGSTWPLLSGALVGVAGLRRRLAK